MSSIKSLDPHLLGSIIEIQKENRLESVESQKDAGFLVTCFSESELLGYLKNGSALYTEVKDEKMIAFALTTPITVFTDQIKKNGSEFIKEQDFDLTGARYFYQMAVSRKHLNSGVGCKLLKKVIESEKCSLVADILTHPVRNDACLCFVKKHGFTRVGELRLTSYRDFGSLVSEVFVLS